MIIQTGKMGGAGGGIRGGNKYKEHRSGRQTDLARTSALLLSSQVTFKPPLPHFLNERNTAHLHGLQIKDTVCKALSTEAATQHVVKSQQV